MPALKMKTKMSKTTIKETSCLHISERSSLISKKSGSHIKNTKQNTISDPCSAHTQHEECNQDIDRSNVIQAQQPLDEDPTNSNKLLSESVKSISTGEMEKAHPVSTNLETIFSPILEPKDLMEKQTFCNGITSNFGSPMLALEDSHDRKSLCDYQTCSISDFYVSDMIMSGVPSEGVAVDDGDITNSISFDDYTCDESGMLFDVGDQCMLVPFLDCTLIKSHSDDATSHEDDTSFYLAISQMSSCNAESHSNSELGDAESFDPHLYIKSLPELSDAVSGGQSSEMPKGIQKRKSVTLVLDLDETLVHSTLEYCDDADFNFTVFFNMKEHTVYVKKRPYLHTFLERVADMFNIVIFTASQSIYAEQLLDVLDPGQKLISRRVYRDSCTFCDGTYTKDLTVLGVDLAKVAIVDNSPQVFQLQVDNGIPIKSWFDDPSDCALISLLPFLETLVDADDVRPIISKRFGNKA